MENPLAFVLGVIVGILIVGVLIILSDFGEREGVDVNSLFCCPKGNSCTDTLYDYKRDECVLTLCQNNPLMKNCTYKPYR